MRFFIILIALIFCTHLTRAQNDRLKLVIQKIEITGNKHTHKKIILRELTFNEGDTINILKLSAIFSENQDLLMNTQLFNFVTISLDSLQNNHTNIRIQVEERWYIWPEVYLMQADRNLSNWLRTTDFSRVKYGLGFSHYNFRGRKEKLSIRFIGGFVRNYAINYNNIYIDKNLHHSLSFSLSYDAPNKIIYNVANNQELVLKTEETVLNRYEGLLSYNYRNKLYLNQNVRLKFIKFQISDTLFRLNNNYLNNNGKTLFYPEISYVFDYDKRNSRHYPLKGYNIWGLIRHVGLGNANNQFFRFELKAEKAWEHISGKLYSDIMGKVVYSSANFRPLITYDELGYNNDLRGFEYYVANGKSAFLSRNTLKYQPFPTQVVQLNYIPVKSINKVPLTFYLSTFFDAGYVKNNDKDYLLANDLPNQLLYAFGMGIDLVTYYDRTFSFYYAHNSLGYGQFYFNIINGL